MSISSHDGTTVFTCDQEGCTETLTVVGVPDYAVAQMRGSRWGELTDEATGQPRHRCPAHAAG